MHRVIQPKIHYYGTPVLLLSTLNEDGSANLAPMSSAWWLGQSCMLGLGTRGQTFANLVRHREVVLNLASADLVAVVNRLALTTGMNPVPAYKQAIGGEYVKDKFERAGLTPVDSEVVGPPRVMECQIALEGQVRRITEIGSPNQFLAGIEVEILRVHCEEQLLTPGKRHYIDPDRWKPLIMSFLEFYSLGDALHDSRLAKVF
jgi:flavin reductase (DIM6/NTAB) family NADH-FMN oxidoreductase RutF